MFQMQVYKRYGPYAGLHYQNILTIPISAYIEMLGYTHKLGSLFFTQQGRHAIFYIVGDLGRYKL